MRLSEKQVSLLETALTSALCSWRENVVAAEAEGSGEHPIIQIMRNQIGEAEELLDKLQDSEAVEFVAETVASGA